MRANHVLAFAQHGEPIAIGRIAADRTIEMNRCRDPARRGRKEDRGDDRKHREQPEVFQRQQQRRCGARADRRIPGEGQRDGDGERRHDERGPRPIALAEQDARQGDADDQHQQSGVGHAVAERALRPLAELVVVQDAVLEDAERRAGGCAADDHASAASSRATRARTGTRAARSGTARAAWSPRGWRADRSRTPPRPASRRRTPRAARRNAAPRTARAG